MDKGGDEMTDKEITEIIATKVMGWPWHYHDQDVDGEGWSLYGESEDACEPFDPLTSDAYVMMAWDKFSEGRTTHIGMNESEWTAGICLNLSWEDIESPDRRRAMCLCMIKAVAE